MLWSSSFDWEKKNLGHWPQLNLLALGSCLTMCFLRVEASVKYFLHVAQKCAVFFEVFLPQMIFQVSQAAVILFAVPAHKVI